MMGGKEMKIKQYKSKRVFPIRNKEMKIKQDKSKLVFSIVGNSFISIFSIACLLPFLLIVIASFTSEKSIITNGFNFFIPSGEFSLEGYQFVLRNPSTIIRAYGVTTFVTVLGTFGAVAIATMTGYVLARKDFKWNDQLSFFFFFTTLFSGGLVPWYLLCTQALYFTDNLHALILPGMFSVWNMIIAKNFMKSIPFELIESGKIDGAGDFRIFYALILPVCKPLLATLGLFTALSYWNDWYSSMLFIKSYELFSLQYMLQSMISSAEALKRVALLSGLDVQQMPMESMKMAMLIITTGPMVLLYPFLQKYFIKGLTVGAIKG